MSNKKTIGIVGTGISAMTCAHYLRDKYDIIMFDKNDYIGGHTHTHKFKNFTIDTGFIVFNLKTYKNMLKIFKQLDVKIQKSDMSFSVYNLKTNLQYATSNISEIFAQKKNLFSLRYWRFILDINKFFKVALKDYKNIKGSKETIKSYCERNNLSEYFMDNYLVPMSSAVWSTPTNQTRNFPIALLLPFFFNHGLLGIDKQYQWYTVTGGSNSYTKKIADKMNIHTNEEVIEVKEAKDKVVLKSKLKKYKFDYVILASHADESLKIAKHISNSRKEMLSSYTYNDNLAVLHTDESIMPPNKKAWASWNHIIKGNKASTIYWMNRLQKPNTNTNYFVSINPFQKIDKKHIIKKIHYNHPLFTTKNFALQDKLQKLNTNTRIFFAGSYFGYGFHEDGCKSGLEVVKRL